MELILEQKQLQKLSPQMIQSMEILQMSTLELHEYVEEQLVENPVLEREEVRTGEEGSQLLHKLEWLAANSRQRRSSRPENAENLADAVADRGGESLYDHLCAQIPWRRLPPVVRKGVECVLTGLNDNGRLEETTEELARRGCVSPAVIERAEQIVQDLEPAGVGARTLAQCLELQLLRAGENGLPLTIVQNHLVDVAKDHYNRIAAQTGASREEIQQACRVIRSLDPKPGAAFAHAGLPVYILPDIFVREEDGEVVFSLAGQDVPELRISEYYCGLLRDSEEAVVKDYLSQKIKQAEWVLKSIAQRKSTVMRCMQFIVKRQEDFFLRGRYFLRPMTLADIASDAGVHESTVSRAVKNKYIQCTWGIFPLNDLFSRKIDCGGADLSAEQVKMQLRALIEQEDKRKPLSDQKLCDALQQQGLTLARRTVAKYRDELGYPSAPGRKQF